MIPSTSLQQHEAKPILAGSKILDFKQTKPFRPARQDDREIFDWSFIIGIDGAPTYRLDFRCRPQTLLLSSIMRSGGLELVDLSAALVCILERRYFRTLLAKAIVRVRPTPEHPIARAI